MLANLISSRPFQHLRYCAHYDSPFTGIRTGMVRLALPARHRTGLVFIQQVRSKQTHIADGWRSAKYVLLIAIIAAAAFSNLTLMVFDPLTIMVRTFSATVWPALDVAVAGWKRHSITSARCRTSYQPSIMSCGRSSCRRMRSLPRRSCWAHLLAIIGLNLVTERFWCRYICPLGALYGLTSKISLIRRRVNSDCINCKLCEDTCPTGTIERKKDCSSDPGECIMCLKCMDSCPCGTSDFGPVHSAAKLNSYDPARRQLFSGSARLRPLPFFSGLIPSPRRTIRIQSARPDPTKTI